MTTAELSVRQQDMLDFTLAFYRENGLPPTVREIGDGCNVSSSSVVVYNLERLVTAGFLRKFEGDGGLARNYVPVRRVGEPCPCCGQGDGLPQLETDLCTKYAS